MTRIAKHQKSRGGRGVLPRLGRGEQGAAAVEFAFVALIFGMLTVGVIDYGTVWARQMALANGIRAGTQYAMVRRPIAGDTTQIRAAVLASLPDAKIGVHDPQVSLFCECPDATAAPSCDGVADNCPDDDGDGQPDAVYTFITVSIQEQFPTMFDYPGLPNPISLSETATMRLN
jgi:Flp pilus assembly pilin Flp